MKKTLLALLALLCTPFALRADTLYVTPTGAGNKDGSSWANAFAGIQAAVDAADAAYAADGTLHDILVGDGTYTRVVVSRNFALQVRSVNGAASTVIDGNNTNGCIRCFANGFVTAPTFTGFTLRNGNVDILTGNDNVRYGGGAGGGTLYDCIVEDCIANWGGGTYSANTWRCIIRRCTATGGGGACAEGGTHRNTLMCQSTGQSFLTYGVTLYNCTVVDNVAERSGTNVHVNRRYNSIVWGNLAAGQPVEQNDAVDPKLVGDGDYRLRVGSPAIDAGDAAYATEQYVGTTDLAGNARVQGNAIDRGCYEAENGQGVEGCLVTAVAGGNGVVSPRSIFTNANASVTITADTSVYNRPVVGWYTNGVLAAASGNTFTLTTGEEDVAIVVEFADYQWFVDGATGSDANDGRTAATAFKTIAKAVSSAINDETVNVAPSTYAPIDTTGKRVNIVGTAGAAATIIDGGDARRCATLSDGTTLTGFTLQHGKSLAADDQDGGGGAKGGTLVACVLRENIAVCGGGAYGATLIRCTVTDNNAGNGGGVYDCDAYNCLVAYNAAARGGGACYGELRGCTVVYNRGLVSGGTDYARVFNSILRYNRTSNGRPNYNLWGYDGNCIDEENANREDGEWADGYTIVRDPLFVDPENGDFRLRAGSPCINYGDEEIMYVADGLDLAGNPRIVDDDPDLGCYESEVEGFVVSVRVDGHGSVSDRTLVVAEGGTATITATTDGRAFQKWLVDGADAGTGATLTLTDIDEDHVVTACFQRNTTTVSGGGAALQNAINAAKDGDTLVVSPGTYSAIIATNAVLDIVSRDGAETTIIQGQTGLLSGTRAATFSKTQTRPTCTLSGFTLTGGFCGDPTYGGGGVFGGIVSNCVIRGNGALLGGGGAAYSMLTHCVVSNNTAYVVGAGAACSALDNCLVVDNRVPFSSTEWAAKLQDTLGVSIVLPAECKGGAGLAFSSADHCTVTANQSTDAASGGGTWLVLDNTIVAGNTAPEDANQNLFRFDTPVDPLYTCTTYDDFWGEIDPPGFVNAATDDTFVNAAAGDYRLKATSACVDGCDGTFDLENPDMERIALLENGTDLVGSPRWLALAPDIGCYETTPAKPGAVPDVAATRSAYREDVLVTWTGAKHGAWYTIHRGPWNNGAGTFAQAEQIGIVTNVFTWYVDDTAEASVDYRYWVVAHSGAGSGPYGAGDHGYWVAPLVITTESLPDGTVREPWTAQLAATGGIGTYTWEVTQPDWLSFSGATLSGVPRVQGDVWVVVTVTDQRGTEAQKAFQISIAKNPNPVSVTISNLAELRQFMEDVHEYYFEGDTVTLAADIDCEGGRFNTGASGSSAYSCFKGTFDGQGHVISNFVNTALPPGTGNTTTFGVAMFDIARDGAVIKDLTLRGHFGHEASHEYAAAFAAYAIGHTNGTLGLTLENCHFIGSVTNYKNSAAFVGAALHGSGAPDGRVLYMTNCTARGSIVSTYTYTVGGLVASGEGVEAADCSFEGSVVSRWTLGGLIGQAYDSSFKNCSFEGTMGPGPGSGTSNSGCGGLVGYSSNAVFRACTSSADITWSAYQASVFTAVGGAAGVTLGNSAFFDCSATNSVTVPYGRVGGFVGWTAGAETFSNCTAKLALERTNPNNSLVSGGFAASVASDGALFVDCTATARGNDLKAGFYHDQTPKQGVPVGSNTFRRCHVVDPIAKTAGFCSYAWNCTFEGCTVRGGTGAAGFVQSAGRRPDDSNSSTYPYAQTSTFTDCAVVGSQANYGFAEYSNFDNKNGSTNVFRRCRASCVFVSSSDYEAGFAAILYKGSIAEDCLGHGISTASSTTYGFASSIGVGAAVRRCVGAVLPRAQGNRGAGFASSISYNAPVEDCYSVFAPPVPDTSARMGGFVSSASVGYDSTGPAVTRCFALAAPADGSDSGNSGSFCGYVYNADYANFVDCWRPAESNVRDVGNGNNGGDDAGVGALTKAQFASATAATMPNYDFQHVWHAPRGVASSPYLDASVDANTNFWFLATVIGGEGRILVNGAEPAEAYPAGTVLTVEAVPNTPGLPFAGWVGEGFADPMSPRTTYTVKNVSAIGASFCTPIYTVADWTNVLSCASVSAPSGNYALMNDLDFTGLFESNGWQNVRVGSFTGKFFGQGHTISNLCTTRGDFSSTVALFRKVSSGAEIRDLTVYSSNVTNDQNTLSMAGLVNEVESGVTISNCHAVVDWQGVYPANYYSGALASCKYYGLAQTVSGVGIRIVDCTVEGKLAGGTRACGFVGSASMTGGEIARCAVFADVSTLTNRTDGAAAGFAGEITLSGGAVVRECFSAGSVDAAADAAGFACRIDLRDDQSQVHDCYSTAEVIGGENQNPAGFVCRISDINDEGGVLPVANCWFGGTARVRGRASQYYQPYGFAHYLDGDASLENCAWVAVDGVKEAGTAGATALGQAASRKAASWPGYDFAGTWSLSEDGTTPYFAWSLAEGTDFRLFAVQEPGTTITHPATALPGSNAAVSADPGETGAFFCSWAGGAPYTNAAVNPSAFLADNHRTVRCVWGKAITTRAELEAVANDPAGVYALGCDIDLGGEPWTPLCQDEYTPFTGTIYGNGHTISNLTVETETARAGLFGGLGAGATIADLHLANPVVRGANCVGTLAGYVDGATISGCTVSGADVTATSERAGCFVGQIVGDTSVSRCSVTGTIAGEARYVGGFVGSAEGSAAIEKCYALCSVTGTGGEGFGGFVGYASGDSVSFSECFACGAVAASGRNSVGGFAGYVYDSPSVSDCYALADVTGASYVGGFAGQLNYCNTAFDRCYAAGSTVGSSESGGFAGRQYRGSPSFTDCFRIADGLADVGAADLVGIDALSAAAMHSRSSFAAFHATGKWAQTDGLTQPYFAWSLVDGKFLLSGDAATVNGLGAYAPGAQAPISANAQGRFFIGWTGGATYADASASSTTVLLDNFRVVDYLAGASISTRAELAAIANDPAGTYGLAADIDLGGADWTPIATFTGKLYGRGHTISNLTVTGSSNYAGLFAYVSGEVSGLTLVNPVVSGGNHTGAFAGCVNAGATVNRCAVIGGRVTASDNYSGVFSGSIEGAASVGECFAVGTIASTASYVGGFSGYVGQSNTSVSDCYAVSDATGSQRVGSFTGHAETSSCSIRRCYAAGTASGSSYAGGFAGYVSSSPVIADCFAQTPSAAMTGVTVLDAAGMRAASNFTAFRAAGCWSQIDGKTQPYFAWGLVDGGFLLSGDTATITGLGACAPGAQAPISVDPTGGIFLGWTGGATYADSSSPSTTVLVDNYRTVSAKFGSLITTRAELEAVANDLAGSYALGADIDLSGSPWTPLGATSSTPFTGSLYGHGHKITGLTFSNTSSGDSNGSHAGLFRYASGATFDGIHLEGVSIRGYQYTGALAGEVQGATTVRNCSAQGVVTNSNGYAGLLVGQVYGSGTSFENCAATGTVYSSSTSSSDCGGLVGRVYYSPASFTDCDVNVEVSGAGGGDKGGFIGAVRDGSAGATFTRCTASGAVASSNSDSVGGFLGYANKAVSCTDCSATGAVIGKNATGGFAGNIDSVAHSFTRCVAAGDASGTQNVGGFVGSTSGGNTQFVECEAQGKATGTGGSSNYSVGGFAGQTTGGGTRFARCSAMGDASAPSSYCVGGFVGYLSSSNDVWRCRAFGSAEGSYQVGGFAGRLYGGNAAIRECFAIGDATASRTGNESLAGGFVGLIDNSVRLSDSYAIGVASGERCIGGFAGKFSNSSLSVQRCYAAGGIECTGYYGGAFVGYDYQHGTVADCAAVLAGGIHAVGTSTAGSTATLAAISELTAAEFRLRANFQAFHETGLWSQVNGSTQPYLAWGLVDGKMSLAGKSVGALGGSISGLGLYEPGATATIRAVATGNAVFLGWTGNAPYADPDAAQTTLVLDNFRCVVASFGTSITTAADLAGIADKLDGSYALGADIDLAGTTWTPIGASTPFTGTLKGNGHVITGLSFSDASNSDTGGNYAGLFRHVQDATIEDIHLEGVSLSGNKYVGALAGEVKGATTIRNCSAEGTVAANGEQAGLLVGRVTGAGTTFSNCAATGAVVSASSSAGGLVGYANVAATFEDCDAAVSVSGKGSAVGGFIGKTDTTAATFRRCSASGDVSNTSDTTGGFVGQSGAAGTVFENCVAEGAVSGTSSVGGFVGSTTGGNTQFVECDALGTVKGSSYYAGGFVGQTTANGIRYALCRALGGVSSTSYDVGGFVGKISNSNDVWRCMSAGSASGTYDVGGFVGNFDGANTAIRECFALGDATSTRTGNNDAVAGGFAGRIGNTNPKISDSYCLGAVSAAARVAGGFAGKFDSGTISLTRCYAAGTVDCPGTYVGAFVGTTNTYAAVLSDCAVLCDGIFAVGLSTAGANDTLEGVAEYDAAGMKSATNFHTWLAIDDLDGSVWLQSDGFSQPVLAWSAPGGKLTIYESIGGSGRGHVDGAYDWYDPGTVVEIAAVPDESFFLDWTGSTPYADPTASPTTIPLDNHRVAAVRFGKLIHDADELDAVRNDLAGYYGLANDIDLTGRDWVPIGFNNAKFTGTFYGFGYEVKNMVCTNSPGSSYHGLFGWTEGATLDGVKVSGVVRSTSQYTGGLVGVANATTIRGCHADVTVSSTAYYTGGLVGGIGAGTTISGCSSKGSVTSTSDYAGGLVGNGGGGNFEIRDCVSSVETVGSTYVGGLIGYVSGGDTVISGCRADGYACCTSQSVGGFIGGVNSSLTISNCVARGDVRCKKGATYAGYGGFVGYMNGSSTVIADSWCSGAVWGQGANCGAFVGYSRYGTVRNCSIYAFGAGPRPFSGSDGNLNGGSLNASQIELLSKDENGDPWPTVKNHAHSATKIRTVEDLFAVTNNLDGIYALANDINLGGAAWTPIGNASAGFTGEFYGENHCISNFVVNSSVSGAGLFGCIAGGRVNGVRAYGSVTGSNEQVGGFVGRLAQMSLVDGCSFSGTVSGSQYVVGGFAGRICDSPVVLRSCAVNCTVTFTGEGGSYKNAYAGGFVGSHDAGYVMDCYAVADVSSVNQARYVGGFAGNVNGQITTSWCAGSAETTGSFLGAFAGYAQSGYITKSYYDSGKTSYLAVSDAAYDGITPLASAQMLHGANFDFDFMATWRIDEGETTPYLRTFLVQLTGFTAWLDEYKLPPDTDPLLVTNGIPLLARYVYGIVPMNRQTTIDGVPLVDIHIGSDGAPWFSLPVPQNVDEYGMRFSVLWSRDLVNWQTLGETWFDRDGDGNDATCHPPIDPRETQMFFKYKIVIDD